MRSSKYIFTVPQAPQMSEMFMIDLTFMVKLFTILIQRAFRENGNKYNFN